MARKCSVVVSRHADSHRNPPYVRALPPARRAGSARAVVLVSVVLLGALLGIPGALETPAIAMPIRPCPDCYTPAARILENASQQAFVWYYRCERCGHVWTESKNDAEGPQKPVTDPRQKGGTE